MSAGSERFNSLSSVYAVCLSKPNTAPPIVLPKGSRRAYGQG